MIKIDSAIDLIFRKVCLNRHIFGQYEEALSLKEHHDETGNGAKISHLTHACYIFGRTPFCF